MTDNKVNTKDKNTKLSTMGAMFMEDEMAGRENISAKDIAIPRLSILQALSPQLNKAESVYIKGAEVGGLLDNVNTKVMDGEVGVIVVPVSYRRAYIEWRPRKLGGGFIKDHGSDDSILEQCTKDEDSGMDVLPNGNEIVTTGEYYCIFIDPETGELKQCVISMVKTQFKKAKLWNSLISGINLPRPDGKGTFSPAMFYQSYKITTVPESNDKGSWFGWKVSKDVPTVELENGEQIYLLAREFRKAVSAGDVKVAEPMDDVPLAGAAANLQSGDF
jgi:hypothetical protein